MKTKSAGAGAMFMKRRVPEPELYHFYDGSTALVRTTIVSTKYAFPFHTENTRLACKAETN